MHNNFLKPAGLSQLLAQADVADLDVLVDYVTDSGKGRVSLNNATIEGA